MKMTLQPFAMLSSGGGGVVDPVEILRVTAALGGDGEAVA